MTSGYDQRSTPPPYLPGPRHAAMGQPAVEGPLAVPPAGWPDSAAPPEGAWHPAAPSPPVDPAEPVDPTPPTPPAPSTPLVGEVDQPGWSVPAWVGPDRSDGAAPPPPGQRVGRLAWPGVTALLLTVTLVGVASFQAYQIDHLNGRLADADRRLAQVQATDASRFDVVEARTTELERKVGAAFNPEAIASAVLPSVFRVSAGRFTGTAFAVGDPVGDGGTNLFTNYHVVESVWLVGGRRVFIEREDQQFSATIVRIDEDNDIAHLRTQRTFTGLVTATEPVKSGQQIVVVGSPLGLADTVTIGVVSAFRADEDGSGTVIQFDAPINPGNSGGPVINSGKEVVGIATAKARDAEGIGLAVPIQTACDIFDIC